MVSRSPSVAILHLWPVYNVFKIAILCLAHKELTEFVFRQALPSHSDNINCARNQTTLAVRLDSICGLERRWLHITLKQPSQTNCIKFNYEGSVQDYVFNIWTITEHLLKTIPWRCSSSLK